MLPGGNIVVSWQESTIAQQPFGLPGWAVSKDAGVTWEQFNTTTSGHEWPTFGTLTGGTAFSGWFRDVQVLATDYSNIVLGLASVTGTYSGQHHADDLALAVSDDGGYTWSHGQIVSDSTATVDAAHPWPSMAWDSYNHDVYILWNQGTAPSGGTQGPFLKRLHVSSTGAISDPISPNPAKRITGLNSNAANYSSFGLALAPASAATPLPRLFFAYPLSNLTYGWGATNNCLTTWWGDTTELTWRLATSVDGGDSWSDHDVITDPKFPVCIHHTISGQTPIRPALAYDPRSGKILYAVSRSEERIDGANSGLRVRLLESSDGISWFSWSSLCSEGYDASGNPYSIVNGQLPVTDPTNCNQYAVTLAVIPSGSSSSRAALTFHDTRTDQTGEHVEVWGESMTPGLHVNYDTQARLSGPISAGERIPWDEPDTGGFWPAWGAHDGLGGDAANGRFLAAWGDSRAGLDPYVVSTRFAP